MMEECGSFIFKRNLIIKLNIIMTSSFRPIFTDLHSQKFLEQSHAADSLIYTIVSKNNCAHKEECVCQFSYLLIILVFECRTAVICLYDVFFFLQWYFLNLKVIFIIAVWAFSTYRPHIRRVPSRVTQLSCEKQ